MANQIERQTNTQEALEGYIKRLEADMKLQVLQFTKQQLASAKQENMVKQEQIKDLENKLRSIDEQIQTNAEKDFRNNCSFNQVNEMITSLEDQIKKITQSTRTKQDDIENRLLSVDNSLVQKMDRIYFQHQTLNAEFQNLQDNYIKSEQKIQSIQQLRYIVLINSEQFKTMTNIVLDMQQQVQSEDKMKQIMAEQYKYTDAEILRVTQKMNSQYREHSTRLEQHKDWLTNIMFDKTQIEAQLNYFQLMQQEATLQISERSDQINKFIEEQNLKLTTQEQELEDRFEDIRNQMQQVIVDFQGIKSNYRKIVQKNQEEIQHHKKRSLEEITLFLQEHKLDKSLDLIKQKSSYQEIQYDAQIQTELWDPKTQEQITKLQERLEQSLLLIKLNHNKVMEQIHNIQNNHSKSRVLELKDMDHNPQSRRCATEESLQVEEIKSNLSQLQNQIEKSHFQQVKVKSDYTNDLELLRAQIQCLEKFKELQKTEINDLKQSYNHLQSEIPPLIAVILQNELAKTKETVKIGHLFDFIPGMSDEATHMIFKSQKIPKVQILQQVLKSHGNGHGIVAPQPSAQSKNNNKSQIQTNKSVIVHRSQNPSNRLTTIKCMTVNRHQQQETYRQFLYSSQRDEPKFKIQN